MHDDKSYNITYRRIAADTDYLYNLFFILFSYEELKDRVSTDDRQYKLVYAISGEIPGPNIVVFEDQIVSYYLQFSLQLENMCTVMCIYYEYQIYLLIC